MRYIYVCFYSILLFSCNRVGKNTTSTLVNDTQNCRDSIVPLLGDAAWNLTFCGATVTNRGLTIKGAKTGVWRKIDQSTGEMKDVHVYRKGQVAEENFDIKDFYFKNVQVDSVLAISVPVNWQQIEKESAIFAAIKNVEGFKPNVIILKHKMSEIQHLDSVQLQRAYLREAQARIGQLNILNSNWLNSKVLVSVYVAKVNDITLTNYDVIYLDSDSWYLVTTCAPSSASAGNSLFLLQEIALSIKAHGHEIFLDKNQ